MWREEYATWRFHDDSTRLNFHVITGHGAPTTHTAAPARPPPAAREIKKPRKENKKTGSKKTHEKKTKKPKTGSKTKKLLKPIKRLLKPYTTYKHL